VVDISSNYLTGSIPFGLLPLPNMLQVDMSNNSLSGSIPVGLLQLPQLKFLNLEKNSLTGEIPAVLPMSLPAHLQVLRLAGNQLSGPLPDFVGRLPSLQSLDLSSNSFRGSLPAFASTGLTFFDVSNNALSGNIPAHLFQQSTLHWVDLSGNTFSGPLPPIQDAHELTYFAVSPAPYLTSTSKFALLIPPGTTAEAWFGSSLSVLQVCSLSGVNLPAGFLARLPLLPALRQLFAASTGVSGTLDPQMAQQLPALHTLDVSVASMYSQTAAQGSLTGVLPLLPSGLQNLIVYNNDFRTLASLQHLHDLVNLVLDGNRFLQGRLPTDWKVFSKLRVLSAQHCSLGGVLSESLFQLALEGTLTTIALTDNEFTGSLVLPSPLNGSALVTLQALDVSHNSIGGTAADFASFLTAAPSLDSPDFSFNLLSCGLQDTGHLGLAAKKTSGRFSLLSGNVFRCPVPPALKKLDIAGTSYTCDSGPLKLNLVLAAAAILAVLAFGMWVWRRRTRSRARADAAKQETGSTWYYLLVTRHTALASIFLFVAALSVLHWGVLYESQYTCAGAMWGSGVYHTDGSAVLLLSCALLLTVVLWPSMEFRALQQHTQALEAWERQPEKLSGAGVQPRCCNRCHLGVCFVALFLLLCLPVIGVDFLVAIMGPILAHRRWPVPDVSTLVVVGSSLLKTVLNSWCLPVAAIACLGEPSYARLQTAQLRQGRARCGCCRCDFAGSSIIGLAQLLTSVVLPLGISLTSLARCTGASQAATLFVSTEVSPFTIPPCADAGVCIVPNWGDGTADFVTSTQTVIRPTCASAGYELFAPQATLVLAMQAVQVLVLALLQWRSGLTLAEMLAEAPQVAIQTTQQYCCCRCLRRHRAPDGDVLMAPSPRSRVPPPDNGPKADLPCPSSPLLEAGVEMRVGRSFADIAAIPLLGPDATRHRSASLNCASSVEAPAVQVEQLADPGAPGSAQEEDSTVILQEDSTVVLPTFDSFQLHFALLMGAVFGAVYPAAAVACATVLGAYALSWHIAPHAQVYDAQVPRWLRSVSLLVYAASLWFVYGPWSMLGEGIAVGATVALVVVSVFAVGGAVWMQVPSAEQAHMVQAGRAAVASCAYRCRTPNNTVGTAAAGSDSEPPEMCACGQ